MFFGGKISPQQGCTTQNPSVGIHQVHQHPHFQYHPLKNQQKSGNQPCNTREKKLFPSLAGGSASAEAVALAKSKPSAKQGEKAKKKNASEAEGTTLEEHLARNKERQEKAGKKFDADRSTKFFDAKDTNNDGVMDEKEKKAKLAAGWEK